MVLIFSIVFGKLWMISIYGELNKIFLYFLKLRFYIFLSYFFGFFNRKLGISYYYYYDIICLKVVFVIIERKFYKCNFVVIEI